MSVALPEGIIAPIIMPFEQTGEVDLPLLRSITEFYAQAGPHALFVLGSAGQGPVMTLDERRMALEVIMDEAEGRIPVIAHVGTTDSFSGRELASHAAQSGVDAIAIVPPYYYSDFTEFEVQRHYCEIADRVPNLPVIIYDNPKYAGISMPPSVAARLQNELPSIAGMKVAFAGLDQMLAYTRLMPNFKVYAGAIEYLAGGVPLGLAGVINPPTSFFPELCVDLWDAIKGERYEEAFRLQADIIALRAVVSTWMARYGRSVFAEVMRMRGFDVKRYPRWTTYQLSPDEKEELHRSLISAGGGAYVGEATFN